MKLAKPDEEAVLAFDGCSDPTVGVEVEVSLVDPDTLELAPRAPELLERVSDPMRFKCELFQSIVEINTDICRSVDDVRGDLRTRFDELFELTDELGVAPMGIGAHPFSDWRNIPITPEPRYQRLVADMGWAARRLLICGLHVHVGVRSGEHAIAVMNSLAAYIPHLLCASASSPFWLNRNTGLASSRVKVFETLPTAGLPMYVSNWSEFVSLMHTLINSRAISTIREVWWDIRPHPTFGTVEIRICDGVNTLHEILAFVAFIQSLVVRLGDMYAKGLPLPVLKRWTLAQNKWRASRFAEEAEIIRNERGDTVHVREHLEETLGDLLPYARQLHCEEELGWLRDIVDRGPSYKRQLETYGQSKDLRDVVRRVVEEFRAKEPQWA